MRMIGMPGVLRQVAKMDVLRLSEEARRRLAVVERVEYARSRGMSVVDACRVVGSSPASYYRYRKLLERFGPRGLEPRSRRPRRVREKMWTPELVREVKRLRRQYGWGKEKLAVLLRRRGFAVSESTVGRILSYLMRRGEVQPSPVLLGRKSARARRRHWRRMHAERMPKGFAAKRPGDLVQVDTLTVHMDGLVIKQFTAVDVVSRWKVQSVFSRATARCARKALEEILTEMPFRVRCLQVDDGSEFMGEFEEGCKGAGHRLFVLPPRSPKLNGHVERANGTDRYEFFGNHDVGRTIAEVRRAAKRWQHIYNHIRPHRALNHMTPAQYLATHYPGDLEAPPQFLKCIELGHILRTVCQMQCRSRFNATWCQRWQPSPVGARRCLARKRRRGQSAGSGDPSGRPYRGMW